MAKLDEKSARDELKKAGPRSLYYLYGEEPYKLEDFAAQVSQGQTTEVYFGDELNPSEFLDAARTMSLFSVGQKVMIVRNADAITAKKWESLEPAWADDSSGSTIMFIATKADARTRHIQAIGKHSRAAMVKFESVAQAEMASWVNVFARKEGKRVSEEARHFLVSSSASLFDLKHNIEKAALFSGNSEEITMHHVEQTGARTREESVFSVMDAILAGNEKEALTGVTALLAQQEEPLGIIALLAKQYDSLLKILALKGEGKSDTELPKELGLHPFVAKKLIPIGRRLGPYSVIQALECLAEADFALKSTREPADLVLARALTKIIES